MMTIFVDAYVCKISRAQEPIRLPVLKLGGSPVFLSETQWPICSHCGMELDFLAQVPLQEPLSVSARYHMAYVFMCRGKFDERGWLVCKTWQPYSGANAVILQTNSNEIVVPDTISEYPDYSVTLEHFREPLVDTALYPHDEQLAEMIQEATKLGGVPVWLQDNETPICPDCDSRMRFVAQFSAELDGSLPADPQARDDERYKFFHFGGDDGIGYLFLCENECTPNGAAFLWQST
jgi:hypothetical protein